MNGISFLLRSIPTVVVLVLLGGIGYFGHQRDWTLPSFQELAGGDQSGLVETEDWCEAHNVEQTRCLACNPELAGADPDDWCKEHGVPESRCTVCHPEILTTGIASDWCAGHGVPESSCTLCNPEIAIRRDAPADPLGITVSRDPGAKPVADPATCQTHAIRVQFASAASLEKAGVLLEAVVERPMSAHVEANGEIGYNQTRFARLAARVPGTVWRVDAEVGQQVERGDVLALVDATEVGRAKAELLKALAAVDVRAKTFVRVETSEQEGFRTNAELQEAEAALREARIRLLAAQQSLANLGLPVQLTDLEQSSEAELTQHLRFLGLPESVVKGLDAATATANLIPVVAPLDGVVVSRTVVPGELADISRALFTVADVSNVWAILDVRPEDVDRVRLGQRVTFLPDGGGAAASGVVSWISTAVDHKTRTIEVRAELDNADGRLRANSFGSARIAIRTKPKAVAVSNEAIHWEGCCHVVFVQMTDETFQTRKVQLGTRSGLFTEIPVGLLPGEVVATAGSYVLKSALLKSRLGAGCVDD